MSASNTTGIPPGCISIPVQIMSTSNTNSSRSHSPYRRTYYESSYNDFSNSPPWKRSTVNNYSRSRFQPRQTISTAYDRLLNNSSFNHSYNDRLFDHSYYEPLLHYPKPRVYEPTFLSRSSEDLLSSSGNPLPSNIPSKNTSFRTADYNHYNSRSNNATLLADSDFMERNNHVTALRRSYDALSDFHDRNRTSSVDEPNASNQQFSDRPFYTTKTSIHPNVIHSTDYCETGNNFQWRTSNRTTSNTHDRSYSPASQRSESPTRPSPSSSQPGQDSNVRSATDATSQMFGNTHTFSSGSSTDQQVPSTDTSAATNIYATLAQNPNALALEKLEQIKQHLADLNQQVDAFTGSTRDDRVYKGLDEQALKMMMCCDELVDVSVDVKEKRKEMILNVQTVLAKLESKVPIDSIPESNSNNQMETAIVVNDSSTNVCEQDKSSDVTNEAASTESSK